MGTAVNAADSMRCYQASTERKRRGLSIFFLDWRVLTKGKEVVPRRALRDAISPLPLIFFAHAEGGCLKIFSQIVADCLCLIHLAN